MYGFVEASTSRFHLFDSYEAAHDAAREMGLGAFTVREVRDHTTGDGRRRAREAADRAARAAERAARPAAPAGEMGTFLAMGQ